MPQIKIILSVHLMWLLFVLCAEANTNTERSSEEAGFKVCGASAVSNTNEKESTKFLSWVPFWSVLSGEQYCEVVDGGRCVTDGGGKYGNNERCRVKALRPLEINAMQYSVESRHDYVTVAGIQYINKSPNGVYLEPGSVLEWRSDQNTVRDGFKLCATPAVAFWSVRSGRKYCEVVDGGRCVTGVDGCKESCRVEAVRPLILNTASYALDTPNNFIAVGNVKYNDLNSS